MRKKTLLLVIMLMSLSLVGLIGFQAYWIHHAVQMEEEVFDRNVNDALHQVVRRLETKEAVMFLKEEAPQLRAAALSTASVATETEPASPAPVAQPAPTPKAKRKPAAAPPKKKAAPVVLEPTVKAGRTVDASHIYIDASNRGEMVSAVNGQRMSATSFVFGTPPNGQVYIRSVKPDSLVRTVSGKFFGHSKLDSVVIWKVLAANSTKYDTIRIKGKNPVFLRRKEDTSLVVRYGFDTLQLTGGIDFIQQVPVNSISSIDVRKSLQGNVIHVYTDSILKRLPRQAFTIPRDTAKARFFRHIPSTREAASSARTLSRLATPMPVQKPMQAPAHAIASQIKKVSYEQATQQKAAAKAQHLNQVMEKMAAEYVRKEKPLPQRLKELDLHNLLALELKNRNICTPYQSKLQSQEETPFMLASNQPELPNAPGTYQVRLFPNDVLTTPSYLQITFPDRQSAVWQNLLVPTFISGLFTLIILLTFYFTLSTILRQKKISEIKNDFINNMTHEFKTPIATISLALDALVNPKVRKDEVRVDYYAKIIKDENRRMHQQVEKVLQTAQMERNKLQLAFEPVDVHQLIQKTAEPFQLHIEQRQGVLHLKLDAARPIVWADPGHLANMVANLLDNANKYSPQAPHIVVQTALISNGLHISVEDQGAGMSREAQKKVFEKFYRVPTGNVHNVKGFGLGLSYVKNMAEAHSGSIHLRSELGKGSKFTLWLPSQNPHA